MRKVKQQVWEALITTLFLFLIIAPCLIGCSSSCSGCDESIDRAVAEEQYGFIGADLASTWEKIEQKRVSGMFANLVKKCRRQLVANDYDVDFLDDEEFFAEEETAIYALAA